MAKLIGISGSLRRGSYNTALLRAAARVMPAGSELIVRTLHGIPLYDGDIEANEGIPPAVVSLKDEIAAADAVLLVTPEYNNGIPGVFKNAIDWLSRPPAEVKRIFADKPFALTGASPGNFGTTLSQAAWLPVLRTLGTRAWFGGRLMVSRAASVFDDTGALKDPAIQDNLRQFMNGFVDFVARSGPRTP
jgi:chromate reductase, NAD(P)H dehydrogenase (quinone)